MAVFFYIYPNQFELENVSLTIIILKIDQEYIICQVLCRLQFIMKGTIIRRRTNMERYGYIRVSTKEQNPERQFIAMQLQFAWHGFRICRVYDTISVNIYQQKLGIDYIMKSKNVIVYRACGHSYYISYIDFSIKESQVFLNLLNFL